MGKEKIIVPAGFQWELSDRNAELRPDKYRNGEETDMPVGLTTAIDRLANFVMPKWRFASVIGNTDQLVFIFTNTLNSSVTVKRPPLEQFVRPDLLDNTHPHLGELNSEPFTALLEGTNYCAGYAFVDYNRIIVQQRLRVLGYRARSTEMYQTGVAFVGFDVHTIDEEVALLEEEIRLNNYGLGITSNQILDLPLKQAELLSKKRLDPIPLMEPFKQ